MKKKVKETLKYNKKESQKSVKVNVSKDILVQKD